MSLPLNRNTARTRISAWSVRAGSHGTIVGTPVHVADQLIPKLQRRRLFRTEYEGKTLRENLELVRAENRHAVRVRERTVT